MADFPKGLDRNPCSREKEHTRDNGSRQWFGFAMAVRVVLVGRLSSDNQPAPNDDGTENVSEGFDGVGNQRMRMAEDARDQFGRGEKAVYAKTEKGRAQTAFEPLIEHTET